MLLAGGQIFSLFEALFNKAFLFGTTAWFLFSLLSLPLIFIILKKRLNKNSLPAALVLGLILWIFLYSFGIPFGLQAAGYREFVAFLLGPIILLASGYYSRVLIDKAVLAKLIVFVSGVTTFISLYGLFDFIPESHSRLASLFVGNENFTTYPNTLAFVLLTWLPAQFYGFHYLAKNRVGKILWAFGCVVNVAAFVLTFSRSAYLAAIVSLLVCAVYLGWEFVKAPSSLETKLSIKRTLLGAVLIALGLLLATGMNLLHQKLQPANLAAQIPLTETVASRFQESSVSSQQSGNERVQFWLGSLSLIKENPLVGVGSGGFAYQYPRYQQELLATAPHPHNLFLKVATENGLPLAILLAVFLGYCFGCGFFVVVKKSVTESSPLKWLTTSLAGLGVMLLLDYNLDAVIAFTGFLLILILLVSHLASCNEKKDTKTLSAWVSYSIFTFLIVFLLISCLNFYNHYLYKSSANTPKIFKYAPFYDLQVLDLTSKFSEQSRLNVQLAGVNKFPNWPELQALLANNAYNQKKYDLAAIYYEKALNGNSLNNLQWHYQYLKSLINSGQTDKFLDLESYYKNLLTAYGEKLALNAHHTVATKNPNFAINIAKVYKFEKLTADLKEVYKLEQNKFTELQKSF